MRLERDASILEHIISYCDQIEQTVCKCLQTRETVWLCVKRSHFYFCSSNP